MIFTRFQPTTLYLKRLFFIATIYALSACSVPEATIQLGGSLNILPTDATFDVGHLPDDWFASGTAPNNAIASSTSLGSSTLSIISSTRSFLVARRIKATLLATPYMSWKWKIEPGKWTYHPIRIVVGFSGGGTAPIQRSTFSKLFPTTAMPAYDRVLSFVWSPSALMRGTLAPVHSQKTKRREARYLVRGGAENVGIWWPETVDLSELYHKSWPTEKLENTRIAFIGVASLASQSVLTAYISDLRLSR